MTRRNGNPRHINRLVQSKPDDIALPAAVEGKYLELCKKYLLAKGVKLLWPASMDRDVTRWRQLRVRHKSGDFRHTEAELKSTKAIAEWTVMVHMELCNQKKIPVIKWRE